MIPIIYDKDEISFISNGLGRLDDCISCKVTEERNGIYECDFGYPITGRNYDLIQLGRIIAVTHDDTGDIQPFDIVSYSKPIDGIVTFHCTHISYRQSLMTVDTSTPVNSLADAFNLLGTATPTNPFSYETDKTSTGYVGAINGIPRSVRQILGGIEGSILDAYGGEYEFDRWTVRLWSARGQLRDFTIRYGVNMTTFNDETDINGTYSSCIPYWTNGEETVVGDKVDSAGATITGRGECVPVDVSEYYEDKPSKAQVEAKGAALMDMRNPYSPTQTIEVSFVRLQDLGFDDLSNLYQCKLCDKINVIFPKYNMTGQFKIVRIVYDVLAGRYESMELGTLSVSLAQALGISASDSSGNNNSNALLKSGGTMTGQILTSFKNSVATGSYLPVAQTVPDLVEEVRYSSGCMGSVSITTAYTKDNTTIAASWYNFLYVPHRSGGVNGQASGDNCNYGTLMMWGMTTDTGIYTIRLASGVIQSLHYTDYVQSYGVTTTGLATSWNVRKYGDGYCEAYAVTGSTGYPMTTQYTNGYYYAATQTLSGLPFTSVTYGQVDRCGGSSSSGLITASVYNLSTSQIQWYAFDTRSETVNCSFAIRIVGKWK